MAFKRAISPTFSREATVMVANDRGAFDKNTLICKFKRATPDELKELRDTPHADVVRRQLTDWELVDKDTNEKVPFSAEELEAILSISSAPQGIAAAFWEGSAGASAKN